MLTKLYCWLFGHNEFWSDYSDERLKPLNKATGGQWYNRVRRPRCLKCGVKLK